jgi:metal-responsive CopG/Arc/MetJ family transcriptional regulator
MICMIRKGEKPMRITINLPERLGDSLKRTAAQERVSVSRLVTGAVEGFLLEKRRRALGKKVLDLAGRARVAPEATDLLETGREDDRA